MDRRIAPARGRNALGVLGLALLLSWPWLGPWTPAPLIVATGMFRLANRHAGSSERLEYAILGAWIGSEVIIALAVALTGGPTVATLDGSSSDRDPAFPLHRASGSSSVL